MPFPNAGQVNTATIRGVSSYLLAKMNTQQTANLVGGTDHIMFDTLIASRGSEIVLDTTDAYSNTTGGASPGPASIGRFLLKAGLTYRLTGSIPYMLASGTTGLIEFGWFDTLNNVELPASRGSIQVATATTHDNGGGDAEAVFTPGANTYVELRLTVATAVTQIGITSSRPPVAYIETL